ncbi:MAG: arginyl-tRNA synthetase [Parcubacteria group bacterium Gr01-1014_3]|nr:MAG: arginyl-tRNA synthetase [Parcubacteria group bacterium Gr01-1014_3]
MINKIQNIVTKALGREVGQVMMTDRVEYGHYSTSAAFLLAKEWKTPPIEAAKKLADKIRAADEEKIFQKIEAVAPGYVNFWISAKVLAAELQSILKFPSSRKATKGKQKICLEFISANPTGPLTMANGRGGFLGDALANILEAVGNKVTREYYINDAGNQVRVLGESILAAIGKAEPKEEHYKGAYVLTLARKIQPKIKTDDALKIGQLAAGELLKEIKQSVKNAGISFDVWFSEQKNLHQRKELPKTLEFLKSKKLVAEHDGAVWLKTEGIADDKDRVLVKSDGKPTYFLADLAYHYDKFIKRGFDISANIWGADHHGYVARLKSGVEALGVDPERLKIIITQLVRLIENGEEVKMSKRKGEFVTMDELIKEVGKDVARFFFLMHSPDTHMDFDLGLAKEQSSKNPVFYTQYAYVRAVSILEKAGVKPKMAALADVSADSEVQLLQILGKYDYMIQQTASDYQVSRVARYALEIARAVHNFYEKERVIDEKGKVIQSRLALMAATEKVLKQVFGLLGISAPEKM